jgi:hypothetical protein
VTDPNATAAPNASVTPPVRAAGPAALPPDPAAYDDPRNVRARAKGLPTPYISGGTDPDPAKGIYEDRYYGRLLVAMVAALIFAGFVLGLLIAIAVQW